MLSIKYKLFDSSIYKKNIIYSNDRKYKKFTNISNNAIFNYTIKWIIR